MSRAFAEPHDALREMLESEFQQLWATQARFHPQLQGEYLGRPWRDWFHDALFFQRPLKPVTGMVGNCLLEPNLPRAPCRRSPEPQRVIELLRPTPVNSQ